MNRHDEHEFNSKPPGNWRNEPKGRHITEAQFTDRILYCVECHEPFVFTRGEQLFFRHRGLMNDPRRCKDCRIKAKMRRENGTK